MDDWARATDPAPRQIDSRHSCRNLIMTSPKQYSGHAAAF
jgi:hypothetical protein